MLAAGARRAAAAGVDNVRWVQALSPIVALAQVRPTVNAIPTMYNARGKR